MQLTPEIVVGLVFLAVLLPTNSFFSIVLFLKRDHPHVRFRSPIFLLIHNLGAIGFSVALSFSLVLGSKFNCFAWVWCTFSAIAFVYLPLGIRAWVFCFQYYSSRFRLDTSKRHAPLRHLANSAEFRGGRPYDPTASARKTAQQLSSLYVVGFPPSPAGFNSSLNNYFIGRERNLHPDAARPHQTRRASSKNLSRDWLVAHKHLVSRRFLLKAFLAGGSIHVLLPLVFTLLYFFDGLDRDLRYSASIGSCNLPLGVLLGFVILTAIYFIAIASFSFILRTAQDAYGIKDELRLLTIIYSLTVTLWIVFQIPPVRVHGNVWAGDFVLLAGMYVSSTISSVGIYVMLLRSQVQAAAAHHVTSRFSGKPLEDLLKERGFVESFREFLSLQLCVENLQFVESVRDFKQGPCTIDAATLLYNEFIANSAPNQVNISYQVACDIHRAVARDDDWDTSVYNVEDGKETYVTPSLFDTALLEVMSIMQIHSLPLFLSKQKL